MKKNKDIDYLTDQNSSLKSHTNSAKSFIYNLQITTLNSPIILNRKFQIPKKNLKLPTDNSSDNQTNRKRNDSPMYVCIHNLNGPRKEKIITAESSENEVKQSIGKK